MLEVLRSPERGASHGARRRGAASRASSRSRRWSRRTMAAYDDLPARRGWQAAARWPRPDGMRIAYVIPAYPPLPSQPFVVNEMIAVQEAGHEVVVLPLYRGAGRRRASRDVRAASGRSPSCRRALVRRADRGARALGRCCAIRGASLRTLGGLHRAAASAASGRIARLLAVTPKALAAAWRLRRLGVERLHAHFANQTADCAAIAGGGRRAPVLVHGARVRHLLDGAAAAERHARLEAAPRGARVRRQRLRARSPARAACRRSSASACARRTSGIPTALFRAEPPPPDGDGLRLLCVARFQEKKGLDTLVDACALLRDRGVRVPPRRLIGDGPLRRRAARRRCSASRSRRTWTLPRPDAAGGGRARAAAPVTSSSCRAGAIGPATWTASRPCSWRRWRPARPVVSCAVSGVPELVRDGETGLIVPPDDRGRAGRRRSRASRPTRRYARGSVGRPCPRRAAARSGSQRAARRRAAGRRE